MEDKLTKLQEKYKKEQSNELRQQIVEELQKRSQHTIDLDNLPPVKHIWVDRGEVMSCEGADHPNHRHFKFKR